MANHVIQEMSPLSLSFTIKRFRDLGVENILAEGLGYHTYRNNLRIIERNTVLIHNVLTKNNYQKVWVWKIKNSENKDVDFFDFSNPSVNSKKFKKLFINTLLEYRLTNRLYIKINRLKAQRLIKNSAKQVLDKSLIYPKLTFNIDTINNFVRSKKVPFITLDEIAMRWADHKKHI